MEYKISFIDNKFLLVCIELSLGHLRCGLYHQSCKPDREIILKLTFLHSWLPGGVGAGAKLFL